MFRKYQAVFRSRWRAVFWSMGVLLTAYCTVPSADGEEEQLAAVAGLIASQAGENDGVGQDKAEQRHVNPWALPPEEQH